MLRHPQALTSAELARRLQISPNAARRLKQRVQLFASEQQEAIRSLMRQELLRRFKGFHFPAAENVDLSRYTRRLPIPMADTLVLYSASQRANKGRARYRHGGQTASIYLHERLGGRQIGILSHIIAWKNGPIALQSIPNLTMQTLGPILDRNLPRKTPLFTDEGYRFLKRVYPNHRMVNHSAKSPDGRGKWARDRWCRLGVHNQVAEGNGRALKVHFAAYGYVSPKYSQLYLNEYAFCKSAKYYGLDRIAKEFRRLRARAEQTPLVTRAAGFRGNAKSGPGNKKEGQSYSDGHPLPLPAIPLQRTGRASHREKTRQRAALAGSAAGRAELQRGIDTHDSGAPVLPASPASGERQKTSDAAVMARRARAADIGRRRRRSEMNQESGGQGTACAHSALKMPSAPLR